MGRTNIKTGTTNNAKSETKLVQLTMPSLSNQTDIKRNNRQRKVSLGKGFKLLVLCDSDLPIKCQKTANQYNDTEKICHSSTKYDLFIQK